MASSSSSDVRRFPFEFDQRYALLLRATGVRPSNSEVRLTDDQLVARFGPWVVKTPLANVTGACITGPYRSYRAIGARLSFSDRGITFGSTCAGGVCVLFREPVTGRDPLGVIKHPGLTVTVADREGLHAELLRRIGDD